MKAMYFRVTVILMAATFFFQSCAFIDIFLVNNTTHPPSNANYVVLADYGLMVMRKDMGKSTWSGGRDMCAQLRLGGFSDWRLPTQGELAILYNERNKIGGFERTRYWSSTPHAPHGSGSGFYVCINFADGSMGYHFDMFNQQPLAVRCVRSAYPVR
ncbi:MAG: DUF1566 domain-containing protein [Rikenellaceae bacterium]|nr:DUF1566 domain-containing protein [Rikenellaceae bacterium]MCL2692329.1 DUF1566 domain-containing protein [Rikenellaceae bacterium]